MSEAEFNNMACALEKAGASFQVLEHAEVRTSEEAAAARGSRLSQGVKSLLVKFVRKGNEFFAVVNLPADRKLDWKQAGKVLQADDVKLASEEEVREKTGCELGGMPPFGHAIKLSILVDPAIFREAVLEFNAGLKTKSVRIAAKELRKAFDSVGVAYFELSTPRK